MSAPGALARQSAPAERLLLAVFALALLWSAFLLFTLQPYFARLVLPLLGGAPAVWSVALVFYQAMLLAGYAYAHVSSTRLGLRSAILLHLALVALAFLFLPVAIPEGWQTPPAGSHAVWQLGLFLSAIGLPYLVLAANAPLLQAWFARTGHPHAADPYFLYGASNAGSFAALLLYVVLIEPRIGLAGQGVAWAVGFGILALLIALAALVALRRSHPAATVAFGESPAERERAGTPLWWMLCGFVPSGLLVAVTAQISLDIAAVPFLWVAPLALFLLTFVIAFARRPWVPLGLLSWLIPFAAAGALIVLYSPRLPPVWVSLAVHLGFLFIASLFCHSLLVASRPHAGQLTRFYLWMSAGGALGGLFAAIAAPLLFGWIAEYVILIVATVLLRPQLVARGRAQLAALAVAAVLGAAVVYFTAWSGVAELFQGRVGIALAIMALAGTGLGFLLVSPIAHALTLLLVLPLAQLHAQAGTTLFSERSFFGVLRVHDTPDGMFRLMTHGTTLHGAMATRPPIVLQPGMWAPEPLTYYHRSGALAAAIFAMQERRGGAMDRVAAIGLGTGSAVCHRAPGERWTVTEIDRSVVRAALSPSLFSFMPVCGTDVETRIGDGRLLMQDEPERAFDLILVDAFSSDSIPVHLMTREAIALYMSRLVEDGIVVLHISNRYLELESVLAAIAREEGLAIRSALFVPTGSDADHPYINLTLAAVIAREDQHFGPLLRDTRWQVPDAGTTRAWTDNYSDVLSALLRAN